MSHTLSPYTPPTAREERAWARAEAIHEHRKAVAFERLATTQRGAEQVIAEALGLDFATFDQNRHLSDAPVLMAFASIYANAMRRAARLPRGVMDLDSHSFALCAAVSATLDRLVERDAEASDDEPADELAEAFRDVYAAAAEPIDTTALTQAFGPLLPETFK